MSRLPAVRDWSFRCGRVEGGFNRYGWAEDDQALFDSVWNDDATALASILISTYQSAWPWLMPRIAQARISQVADGVRRLGEERLIGQGHTYRDRPDTVYDHAMMYGSFDHMRMRRTWDDPSRQRCAICKRLFRPETLSHWMLTQYGPPRYCPSCCCRARWGCQSGLVENCAEAVRRLSRALSAIPPKNFAYWPVGGLGESQRDDAMRALITTPEATDLESTFGGTWLRVLQASDLVGEAWRPGRGTYCIAADGHACRSLAEKSIDDFFSQHLIPHEVEPTWPFHPDLNPSSGRRADWGIPGGVLVEYAGLMPDAGYSRKMADKQELAKFLSIPLIVVTPDDLPNLAVVFEHFIPEQFSHETGVADQP